MSNILKRGLRKLTRPLQRRRFVEVDGIRIPPAGMRLGGAHFLDDREFVESGRRDVRKLVEGFGTGADSRVLDIGCGVGRLPIGMLAEFGKIRSYTGVDVSGESIAWCERNIAPFNPGAEFILLGLRNDRYNPAGHELDEAFRIPVDPGFDAIFLYSVFSHMETEEVKIYLREFHRLLSPDGGVFLTAFVEDDVPDMTVNPEGYGPLEWEGPLHCVRFSKGFFEELLRESGFEAVRVDRGTETDGQSAIYLRPR